MSSSPGKSCRNRESGFALLFIYAMAATVAIMLYVELPRVAFEAQRDKEQLLIDRGEQYSRAVTLFVRKFNRYPADIDALQSTQNLRFLRHKYVDPMTGKDWRLIHVGPGGVFTDSLLYTKKKVDKQAEQQTFITEMQQIGANPAGPNQGANIATRQRPSDQAGAPGDPNNTNQPPQPPQLDPNGQPIPNNPNANPNTGINGPVQVLPDGRIVPVFSGNQAGGPGQLPTPAQFPQGTGALPAFNPQQAQQFPGGVQAQQVGQLANAPPVGAANLINQMLTSPRPGGLNGFNGQQQATVDQNGNPMPNANGNGFGASPGTAVNNTGTALPPMAGQTIGGGIAGVASKLEQDGIKIYRDRTSYNEWEFVYDLTKDTSRAGGAQIPTGAQSQTANTAAGANAAGAIAASTTVTPK